MAAFAAMPTLQTTLPPISLVIGTVSSYDYGARRIPGRGDSWIDPPAACAGARPPASLPCKRASGSRVQAKALRETRKERPFWFGRHFCYWPKADIRSDAVNVRF